MRIAKLMAGFNPIEVDSLRKSMSDKDESIIEKQREKFIKGCVDSGYHKDLALSIFENIKLFSGYAFNSSHALAYSYVAYITAYLKANYLLEFDIACLNKEIGKDGGALEDTTKFVLDLEAHNYKVKPPDVTLSNWDFSASNKREIHYALGAIKGISSEQMKEWTALRPFASLDDAIMKAVRSGVSSASIVLLATLGAFETLAPNTPHVMKSIVARVNKAKKLITNLKNRNKSDKKKLEKDPCFFTADSIQLSANALKLDMGDTSELSKKDTDISVRVNRIKTEMECLGFSVSGTLLDEYSFHVHRRATMTTSFYLTDVAPNETASVAGVITKLRKTTDKNGKRMGFLTISDGRSEVKVVVFGSVFESFADATWKEGKAIIVDGRKDDRDGMTLISSDIVFLHKDATNEEKANQEGSKAKDNTNTSKK
jgi:DNA polymerase-3 subunit alpha